MPHDRYFSSTDRWVGGWSKHSAAPVHAPKATTSTSLRMLATRTGSSTLYRDHGVLGVFLSNGNATGAENASLVLAALPDIEALAETATPPAMYRLAGNGRLTLWKQL